MSVIVNPDAGSAHGLLQSHRFSARSLSVTLRHRNVRPVHIEHNPVPNVLAVFKLPSMRTDFVFPVFNALVCHA